MSQPLRQLFVSILLIGLALPLGLRAQASFWPSPPVVSASAWMLVDATTGQTLAARNATEMIDPASLTKLMTAYLTFQALRERRIRLDQNVPAPPEAAVPAGSRMFLVPDKNVPVSELLAGLTILGANDAAIGLANAISGSEEDFVLLMNKTAERLGLDQTRFANATGIAGKGHWTTVADLMKLSLQLVNEYPEHLREFNKRELTHSGIRQVNRNRLLWLDNSVDGLMTGRSEKEGFAMAVSAHRPQPLGKTERLQRRLMAIIVGAKTEEARSQEGLKLVNFGFQQFDVVRLFHADEFNERVPVFKGATGAATLQFGRDVLVTIPRGQSNGLKTQLERPQALLAPITAGQPVGQLRIWLHQTEIHQVPVVTAESVQAAGILGRAIDAARLWWRALRKTGLT
jgi:D-alanyl-D-alanine carboxypeptidase (penicillin-binding protein 5/6)